MKSVLFLSALLLAVAVLISPSWAGNPFFAPPPQEENGRSVSAEDRPAAAGSPFRERLNDMQREFQQKLTGYARQIRENPGGGAAAGFLAFVFVYGVLHALGPGHGKTIVFAYFLSQRGTFLQALLFGNLITFMHVLSATLIVSGLNLFGKRSGLFAVREAEEGLQTVSYLLIVLIGIFLLYRAGRDVFSKVRREEIQADSRAGTASMLTLALSAGLVPCPGAALILLFTLSLDIFSAGLVAMLFLGAGMGLTNTLVGAATLGSRNAIMRLSGSSPKLFRVSYALLALSGALIVTLFGFILFLGNIGSA